MRTIAGQAVRGVYQVDLTSTVLGRAMAYRTAKLGSLDTIHLASAKPFRSDLSEFVTYDKELSTAAEELGFPVLSRLNVTAPRTVGPGRSRLLDQ